ncbi:mechanosensitive ion channel family protein [Cerasicoccus arenae]|uniref:Mechanosensitive ion channel protein n=1 Tax=Cerasicoccus arenae TaxID=424488 RepID=A0A8J3DGS4_9BACT|nr:mechanosensitive ion channel domain-containing protein [Cerasicoccus arenae]MBK1858674.1 mechanosensitive ion channel [Cerasicoccus arenae]GHB98245.1 mechanosensitive ion channel protein [Cerasicoccus arenae]
METETQDIFIILQGYAFNVLWALLTFFVGKFVAKLATTIARKTLEARKVDATIVSFLSNVLYAILMVIVILMAGDELGIETTSLIAVLGASTLAIGLALQGSLANFAAGFMLVLFRHFRVGDFIEAGGVAGIVLEIKIFDTKMRTGDNKVIIVPNGQILGGPITNYSAMETRRLDLVVGVSYDDDIRKVKEVLTDIVASDPGTLAEPEPTIGLLEMADSSVNFAVRPWVNTGDYWVVFFRLQESIKLRLDEEGISIPYPQRDVHMLTTEKKPA